MGTAIEKPKGKPRGRPFPKGVSGNPSGRPKRDAEVQALARTHTADAVATLHKIMMDEAAQHSARVSAAGMLLDRGWGRAPARLEVEGSLEHFFAEVVMGLDAVIEGEAREVENLPASDPLEDSEPAGQA